MGKGKKSESKVINPKDRSQTQVHLKQKWSQKFKQKWQEPGKREDIKTSERCWFLSGSKVVNKGVDKKKASRRETPGLLTGGPK